MIVKTWAWALAITIGLLAPVTGWSTGVTIRSGDHPGFGRIVFDLPAGDAPELRPKVGVPSVCVSPVKGPIALPGRPRNVLELRIEGKEEVCISFANGSQFRQSRPAGKLVLDFLDPPTLIAGTRQGKSDLLPRAVRPIRRTVSSAARETGFLSAPSPPPLGPSASLELIARSAESIGERARDTAVIPFGDDVGAAAFWHDGRIFVVFDERRPIDTALLRGAPALSSVLVRMVASGTILEIPAPAGSRVVMAREAGGWSVGLRDNDRDGQTEALSLESRDGELRVASDAPGRVVAIGGADSAVPLLVGTLRRPHASVLVARQFPEVRISPTFLGLVVEPVSDRTTLRAGRDGFVVTAGVEAPLAISNTEMPFSPNGRLLSRSFDFPRLPLEALLRRLQAMQAAAANAPPQERVARRLEVTQALLALGMGAEAEALLDFTTADAGRASPTSEIAGLRTAASLLAGRFDDADGPANAAEGDTDEGALWHGLLMASKGMSPRAAASLIAATYPILLAYPAPLRDRLLPLAVETLLQGGQMAAARGLVAGEPASPRLDVARATMMLSEARENDATAAIQILDRVSRTGDQFARSSALGASVELRLASGAISANEAADQLDRALYAWRGDNLELGRRLRVAALRRGAGQWKLALATLREALEVFPERARVIRPLLADAVVRTVMADGPQSLAPFDVAALAEENADLLPGGALGRDLAVHISDQLQLLELPRRAADVLARLLAGTPEGEGRAEYGVRLAALRMSLDDAPGALAALSGSAAPDLPTELVERRTLAFARAAVAVGDRISAMSALVALNSPQALDLRARLLEQSGDWTGATEGLRDLLARKVGREGPVDREAAKWILRLAGAAAQTGDRAALASIRADYLPRLADKAMASILEVMTAAPIDDVADIGRAAKEASLIRALPAGLATVGR